jgi:deazaflavin-dependent oxidoreductase (nitroreductase family)
VSSLRAGLIRAISRANVRVYRWSDGKIGGRAGGAPILLLTTRGRRSGKLRTTPLLYLRDGIELAVVASNGGSLRHPAWYLNVSADVRVEIQIRGERFDATARTASPEQRERLWPRLVEMYGPYASYQARTSREIPVVQLTRNDEHSENAP